MLLKLMALVTAVVHVVSAEDRSGSVLHQGESEGSQSVIITSKTRAFLSCESGDMIVKVNFTQPFRGLMYTHKSRNSPCRVHGSGDYYYELRIPLKGCGTWQESPRVFVNNITIRFHPALELEEDETKTVVCRYPPPKTPSPGSVQIIEPAIINPPSPIPTRVGTARLSEVEILIIICLLLFLSLLILGIGIAYFCLKRRNIHIIRKSAIATSSAPPSQITRLSGSNLNPPSSLLSSVLGHTVRIPRAVPYSAPTSRASALSSPDHHYEDYPASTSMTENTSEEVSETSVSSSSLEDQVDASRHLLYRKDFPKSILSIPKAILRNGAKRWQTEPSAHQYLSKSSIAAGSTSVSKAEMEDQTVTTMLEPEKQFEDDSYTIVKHKLPEIPEVMISSTQQTKTQKTMPMDNTAAPVYAQVHKPKKLPQSRTTESLKPISESKRVYRPPVVAGAERRQRQVLTTTPEKKMTTEEITKNTTIVTSVKREIAETRVLSPLLEHPSKERNNIETLSDAETDSRRASALELQLNGNKSETSTLISNVPKVIQDKELKSLLIRDVADIYLTTTVETESREQITTVSRDIVEQHARNVEPFLELLSSTNENVNYEQELPDVLKETNKWNVVIRQRKQSLQPAQETNLDASGESNGESSDEQQAEKPQFDVTIRTILPDQLKPKTSDGMIDIPPLEMPETISKLKQALMPKTLGTEDILRTSEVPQDGDKKEDETNDNEKSTDSQRTVRWLDDMKASRDSTVSSSDSFQSAESLRERSSSEVLEVAPTLPSHSTFKKYSSDIATSPEDQVRWVGGMVPVLEPLSPEYRAKLPIVIQGGFFNKQRALSSEKDKS